MKLALLTIVVHPDADLLDAHLAFHLNAGVDVVVASGDGQHGDSAEVLDAYTREGYVRRAGGSPTDLARLAAAEHGADWVIPAASDEFWWPRGENLKDVLAVIPSRYAVAQGLVREFAVSSGEGGSFWEVRTARTSLLERGDSGGEPLRRMLRPVYRVTPNIVIDADDWTLGGRRVPLRAWYPIEVLHFPASELEPAERISLVEDTRLRDALRSLRNAGDETRAGSFALPAGGGATGRITFPVPSIVDDASYAVECAAVGEVDLVRLDRQIRELELRLTALEARFWPRVRHTLRRLARRPR